MSPATSGAGGRTEHQFHFGATLPIGPVPAGTNVLVEGASVDGTDRLLDQLLTTGRSPGEAAVLVSTDGAPQPSRRQFREADNVGLVCCGVNADETVPDEVIAASVASPGDLTGIGIQFSKTADAVSVGGGSVRVGVDSISTLLMYVEDARSVFRFVHAFTGRIAAMNGLGLFVVDPDAHDDRTMAMVRGPFDGRIQLRTGESGPELRASGFGGQPSDWQPFDL